MHLNLKRRTVPKRLLWLAAVALAAILAVPITLLTTNTGIKTDRYQMVKLVTGEVFFGKLKNTKGDYIVLEDAYYTQESKDSNEVTLIARKDFIAGTESPLRIQSDQVVYWENLAKDGRFSQLMQENISK